MIVISTDPAWGDAVDQFVQEYENAIVYADIDQETVLHEGQVRVLANGWVALPPRGRL